MADEDIGVGPARPFVAGLRVILTLPGLVLFWSAFGFGAFAQSVGMDPVIAPLSILIVWALPAQVVLSDQIGHGASLFAAGFAVTLTAVRLMPLTVAIMPVVRQPRTSMLHQLAMSHFVAVTVWVTSMTLLPRVPREKRVAYYWGIALGLIWMSAIATALGYRTSTLVPVEVAAGLMFLTPLYFLLSMSATARDAPDRLAIPVGLALGPVFHLLSPQFDLALTGLVGGTAAYVAARLAAR